MITVATRETYRQKAPMCVCVTQLLLYHLQVVSAKRADMTRQYRGFVSLVQIMRCVQYNGTNNNINTVFEKFIFCLSVKLNLILKMTKLCTSKFEFIRTKFSQLKYHEILMLY